MAETDVQRQRRSSKSVAWSVRIIATITFFVILYFAIVFISEPAGHLKMFQLSGVPGQAAVRALGVAMVVWLCTYPLVIFNPRTNIKMFFIVLLQQVVTLAGALIIRMGMPVGYATLAGTLNIFILADAICTALLLVTFIWMIVLMMLERHDDKKRAKAEARAAEAAERDAEEAADAEPLEGEYETAPVGELPAGDDSASAPPETKRKPETDPLDPFRLP
ncbi:hypothetical protein [Slackia heliotrinireducens]|uniref:hypothetical protein n=1 Tax=Slackia heliotrinireducens TaxID=84110 RepID=UPI0033150325